MFFILQVGGDKKSESVGEGFLKGAKLCNQVLSFDGILGDKRVFIRVTKKAKILKNEGRCTTLCRFSRRHGDSEEGVWLIRVYKTEISDCEDKLRWDFLGSECKYKYSILNICMEVLW